MGNLEIKENVLSMLEQIVTEENKFYEGQDTKFKFTMSNFVEQMIIDYYEKYIKKVEE